MRAKLEKEIYYAYYDNIVKAQTINKLIEDVKIDKGLNYFIFIKVDDLYKKALNNNLKDYKPLFKYDLYVFLDHFIIRVKENIKETFKALKKDYSNAFYVLYKKNKNSVRGNILNIVKGVIENGFKDNREEI